MYHRVVGHNISIGKFGATFSNSIPLKTNVSSSTTLRDACTFTLGSLFNSGGVSGFRLTGIKRTARRGCYNMGYNVVSRFTSMFKGTNDLVHLSYHSLRCRCFPFGPRNCQLMLMSSMMGRRLTSSTCGGHHRDYRTTMTTVRGGRPRMRFLHSYAVSVLGRTGTSVDSRSCVHTRCIVRRVRHMLSIYSTLRMNSCRAMNGGVCRARRNVDGLCRMDYRRLSFLGSLTGRYNMANSHIVNNNFNNYAVGLIGRRLCSGFVRGTGRTFGTGFNEDPGICSIMVNSNSEGLMWVAGAGFCGRKRVLGEYISLFISVDAVEAGDCYARRGGDTFKLWAGVGGDPLLVPSGWHWELVFTRGVGAWSLWV